MASPRVLVVSSSAGHGHIMSARALSGELRRRHPVIDTAQVDALDRSRRWYGRAYRGLYLGAADRAPTIWRYIYDSTNRRKSFVGGVLTQMGGRPFVQMLERWKPDALLCTHFLPVELLQGETSPVLKRIRIHLVVTDYDVHGMWQWPNVDRYYVASDLVKARLCLRDGVPESDVQVTGIPVRRMFGVEHDKIAIRARQGLDPSRPVVLFLSGGFASGPMRQAILGIWLERRDVQIVAVCGGNERLRRAVARLPRPSGAVLRPLAFVENPGELMAVSDIVVAKAGGITVAECGVEGKPLVISSAIPGQEERNVHALEEAGAGIWAPTPEEVRWRVARLLESPERLAAMSEAATRLALPNAARDIADAVAGELVEPVLGRPIFHGAG